MTQPTINDDPRTNRARVLDATFWAAAILVSTTAFLFLAQAAFDFTIDDVFISMRYADNLARHGELVWNPGETVKVEGYSNLLWVLTLAGAYRWLPWDPLLMTKALSIGLGVMTLVVFSLLTSRLMKSRLPALIAPLILAVSRPFILWSVSGMENMLYLFLVCLALWMLVREDCHGRLSYWTPVVLFLICLTRTEGVVFFASVFLVRFFRLLLQPEDPDSFATPLRTDATGSAERAAPVRQDGVPPKGPCGSGRTDRRRLPRMEAWTLLFRKSNWFHRWIVYNAIFSALFMAWMIWKLWYYGSIIPLPVLLKTAEGGSGILYVRDFMVHYAPYVPLAILGGCLTELRKPQVHIVGFLLLYLAALSLSNPIMGMHFRLILAAWPLILLLALLAMQRQMVGRLPIPRIVAVLGIGLFMLHWEVGFPHLYRDRLRGTAENYQHFLRDLYIPLGHWFREVREARGDLTVALHDAGATPFYAADCRIIDMLGLNDPDFARTPMTPDRLLARKPDYVVLKSASTQTLINSDDADYGTMSNMIYNDPLFQDRYTLDRVWSDQRKVYIVWVFGRKS